MILTERQQVNLFSMLSGGQNNNSGGSYNFYLDGQQMSDVVVEYINNGKTELDI